MRTPLSPCLYSLVSLLLVSAACDQSSSDAAAAGDMTLPTGMSTTPIMTEPIMTEMTSGAAGSSAQQAKTNESPPVTASVQAGTGAPAVSSTGGGAGSTASLAGAAGTAASVANAGASASAAGSGGLAGAEPIAGAAGTPMMAAAGDSAMLPPPPEPAPLQWTRCGNFECAELEVPLDYADPTAEQITLAVQRRAARGQRLGSLLINPGGPGGSAVEFLSSFVQVAGSALTQRFDIVAFDPRGVGESTPLDCHSTIQQLAAVDPSPDSEAEWMAADQAAKAFADECAQKHAKLLPHLGTPNVARDMDQVRAALGEDKLNYLGFSYGTAIGAEYAELFPERVRALVLDGALDMSLAALDISLEQAEGFEQSLQTYFDWCGRNAGNCRWTNSSPPADAFKKLSDSVDAQPLTTRSSGRSVGPGEFLIGVITPLYGGEDGYRALSSALTAAGSGDGTSLLSFTDSYLDRRPDGSYGNIQEANAAVNCLDAPSPDYAGLRAEAMRFEMASKTFGLATLTGLLVCAHWPVKTQPGPVPHAAGAAPILVVGTTGDPATPYAWAKALASELESGVLLTYEGEGHTAYGRGVPCIDAAVEAYLVDGTVPAADTRCGGSSAPSPLMLQVQNARGPRATPQQFGLPTTE